MVNKAHQPVSMEPTLWYEFQQALKGTRFENNNKVNTSAAICELMRSVVDEKKKNKEVVMEKQLPNTDILQTTDEYVTKQINKVLDIGAKVVEDVVRKQKPETQRKIYNYFSVVNEKIENELRNRDEELVIEEPREATEYELNLLKQYEGKPEQLVISSVKDLRREVEKGMLRIPVVETTT